MQKHKASVCLLAVFVFECVKLYFKDPLFAFTELLKRTYFVAGRAMALSLTIGGPAPFFLGEITPMVLAFGETSMVSKMDEHKMYASGVIDAELLEDVNRVSIIYTLIIISNSSMKLLNFALVQEIIIFTKFQEK